MEPSSIIYYFEMRLSKNKKTLVMKENENNETARYESKESL